VREELKLYLASFVFLLLSLITFLWLAAEYDFPLLAYVLETLPRPLLPLRPFKGVSSGVGRFLWDWRVLDLLSQAFVILSAVICCLALLKPEGEER
jgi:hypothetical protein